MDKRRISNPWEAAKNIPVEVSPEQARFEELKGNEGLWATFAGNDITGAFLDMLKVRIVQLKEALVVLRPDDVVMNGRVRGQIDEAEAISKILQKK